jgi:hypothetical protein
MQLPWIVPQISGKWLLSEEQRSPRRVRLPSCRNLRIRIVKVQFDGGRTDKCGRSWLRQQINPKELFLCHDDSRSSTANPVARWVDAKYTLGDKQLSPALPSAPGSRVPTSANFGFGLS